eukprot:4166420-Alexandrium_andersonii.AAC.1
MERLDEEWTMDKFEQLLGECRDPGAQAWKDGGEELNQDLWWVLVEKTTGEALHRVKGTVAGEGLEAYRK